MADGTGRTQARKPSAVLVTGGADSIGSSHTVLALRDEGREVVALDDLSNGDIAAIPDGVVFHRGDVADGAFVTRILREHRIELVMHLAGSVSSPESVARPLDYMRNNAAASEVLARACVEAGVRPAPPSTGSSGHRHSTKTPTPRR